MRNTDSLVNGMLWTAVFALVAHAMMLSHGW